MITIPIYAQSKDEEDRARKLAEKLDCEYLGIREKPPKIAKGDFPAALVAGKEGLWLEGEGIRMRGDFQALLPRVRTASLRSELLVKASGINKRSKGKGRESIDGIDGSGTGALADRGCPRAIDATAGLGEDSFLLAAAGFSVTMCEKDPVIAALLRDAMERAMADDGISANDAFDAINATNTISTANEINATNAINTTNMYDRNHADGRLREIVSRMTLVEGDSIEYMRSLREKQDTDSSIRPVVDMILLDPMFPQRTKSALVKKKFQLIHLLEKPCEDEEILLQAAMQASPGRILIKRPVKGPWLANVKPAFSLSGKAVRYDCLLPPYGV